MFPLPCPEPDRPELEYTLTVLRASHELEHVIIPTRNPGPNLPHNLPYIDSTFIN